MEETLNEKIVNLNLKRIEICDLLIATTIISSFSNSKKWNDLHNKLCQILDDFDKKNFKKE